MQLEKYQWTDCKNLTNGMQETTLKRATDANPFTHILRKDLPMNDVKSMVMALLRWSVYIFGPYSMKLNNKVHQVTKRQYLHLMME